MKHWHRLVVLTCILSLLIVSAAFAASLDTPSVSTGTSGHAKQTLFITAGPSGAPNGFTVRWMDASTFYGNGGQFQAEPVAGESNAAFTGEPTLNTFGGQYTTFKIGPNETIRIEIGDLADESGVTGDRNELATATPYYFAVFANDENGNPGSELSVVVNDQTTAETNCTFTQGYWKNHGNAWPVSTLTLGTVNYTKQNLLDILNEDVNGNGLISLCHQLIAAKLNIAQGADPSAASACIAAADAIIGGLVCPPVGGGSLNPADTDAITQCLDDYNNGITGPGHCGTVPTKPTTWGAVKSLYR
jgi:hypothetical protein